MQTLLLSVCLHSPVNRGSPTLLCVPFRLALKSLASDVVHRVFMLP